MSKSWLMSLNRGKLLNILSNISVMKSCENVLKNKSFEEMHSNDSNASNNYIDFDRETFRFSLIDLFALYKWTLLQLLAILFTLNIFVLYRIIWNLVIKWNMFVEIVYENHDIFYLYESCIGNYYVFSINLIFCGCIKLTTMKLIIFLVIRTKSLRILHNFLRLKYG